MNNRRSRLYLQKIADETRNRGPGLPEVGVGLSVYVACIFLLAIGLWLIPDSHASLRGSAGSAGNGAAGVLALLAAARLQNTKLNAFGFRAVAVPWINAGILLGFVAVGLSMGIEHIYFSYVHEPDTQADFKVAATSSLTSLIMLCLTGAILTPFGEEVLFRGVVATTLNRYGPLAGIFGSAVIFAAAHGPSVIFFDALMAGLLTAALFRKTGSLWPGFALHGVYNICWLLLYSLDL